MIRKLVLLTLLLVSPIFHLTLLAQGAEVSIFVGDSLYAIRPIPTQIHHRRGWDIAGYSVGKGDTRYITGTQSKQLCDSSTPLFIIRPTTGTLFDMALVRLNIRHKRREFATPHISNTPHQRIDLATWHIAMEGEDAYRIKPLAPLSPGEYIFINLSAPAIDKESNVLTYGFTIR